MTALQFPDSYYQDLQSLYTKKRATFLKYLDAAGLIYTEPQGAYYVMIDVSEFGWKNDVSFCEWLAREGGIAAVPGSSFFHEPVNHLVRLHFAKRDETLAAAGERLLQLRAKVRRAASADRARESGTHPSTILG